jgi:uncharacterized membrane protein YgcG
MRFKKHTILTILFLFLMSISTVAFAASKYVDDGAGVLSSSMQDKISTNFQKVEQNSGAVVKMVTVKSLNKQDVKAVAQAYASKNLSGDKYALFLVAPNDGKTQFLVGSGLNAVFSSADIDKISHLPDSDFKSKKFDDGFSKVGQAIDQKITSTAVKTGDAKVSSNGYSNTVKPATPWGKYFVIFLIIVIIVVILVIWFRKKAEQEQEKRKKQFINDNYDSLHDLDSSSASFKTASVDSGTTAKTTTTTYAAPETAYKPYTDPIYDNDSYVVHETHETVHTAPPVHRQSSGTSHTTVHNTTIVNNNNRGSGYNSGLGGNGFVEGMLVNEMLHDHDHHHHDHHDDYYEDRHHDSYKEPEKEVTSGSWDNGGTSSWGSSSSDSGSSSWSSSRDDDSSSSWGSSSSDSYDSGSSWDSGSSDSGSSDW